jgi:hypothetical protein
MTEVQIFQGSKVIHRSRNLRGIFDHARRVGLTYAVATHIKDTRGTGELFVKFNDDSFCCVIFADWYVLRAWIKRRRSWKNRLLMEGTLQ